ncbi:MAG: hypothetical protein GY861_12430 [bacterium]|nr:hypothetical protein [bacterium]
MGVFYDTYYNRVVDLFEKANKLDKPIRDDVTWAVGMINGRNDYLDSQCHVLALVASIIINEPVVPRIICAWEVVGKEAPFVIEDTKYFKLCKSPFSVKPYPGRLGLGYRAKYLGLNLVKTPYGIMSDIDTVCVKPCIDKYMDKTKQHPNVFCWTNYKDRRCINSGFVVFNMQKYFSCYLPAIMQNYWNLPHRDSEFIKFLQNDNELRDKLTIGVIKDKKFICTKFWWSARRDDEFDENTSIYHAWKGDIKKGEDKFYEFYDGILKELERKGYGNI